jgi:hypothetical protein
LGDLGLLREFGLLVDLDDLALLELLSIQSDFGDLGLLRDLDDFVLMESEDEDPFSMWSDLGDFGLFGDFERLWTLGRLGGQFDF